MRESRMQSQSARPVWRALDGDVPRKRGNAPSFDPIFPISIFVAPFTICVPFWMATVGLSSIGKFENR